MKALGGFFRDERGMAPYSLLGISMLLIVGVAIYHFNNVDIQKAQERNALTMDMETFYSTVKVGQDLHQVARTSAESVILNSSMATYENPIQVNSQWGSRAEFEQWKSDLEKEIANETEKEIYNFYHQGNQEALEKQYYNPSTDFDFSNFIKENDIEVTATQDSYDRPAKVQNSLVLNVDFKDGGKVSSTNKYTGYELAMNTSTLVSVDARPFTMADNAYNFTQTFNDQGEADELSWYIWGLQEVLGLMEANVKRDVRFATDDRVSYSFMHLLIAYKELEHFGTFDYVHTVIEFLRPWMGAEEEGAEFLSLLTLSLEGDYVDQAIASMDAAIFVSDVADSVQDISDSMIEAASHLDSDTVTKDGAGFESSEVSDELLSGEGTVQHLERAEDTEKLTDVYDKIMGKDGKKEKVTKAKNNVEDDTVDSLSVSDQLSDLKAEYIEVRDEWDKADGDFTTSQNAITSAREGYSYLNSTIKGKICENPIAAMLWFGDSNQKVRGFREILSAKVNETNELVEYYVGLETAIDNLSYESVADSYYIDRHYENARDALEEAEMHLDAAKDAKTRYDLWHGRLVACQNDFPCVSPACKPRDCKPGGVEERCFKENRDPEPTECCKTTKLGDEKCYYRHSRTYTCTCESEYQRKSDAATEDYITEMYLAERNLTTAASNVSALQTQIDAFFTDKRLLEFYGMVEDAHGIYTKTTKEPLEQAVEPYSVTNNYYSHWDYSSCPDDTGNPSKKHICAKELIQDFPASVNEKNYQDMPSGPLTYDAAHENYNSYGLYYIKHVIDMMNEMFGGDSVNQTTMEEGKKKLEEMKNDGVFKKINAIIKPIKALVDTAGDIKSAVATIKNAEAGFPNINEHFYTTLPLPPFNGSEIGFDYQGFTVVHDVRLRSDTSPGRIKIPIINREVSLGIDSNKTRVVNPSFPIPYTPIFVYLWQFEVGPSIGKDSKPEQSTLWLIDTESSQIAPLMELKVDDSGVPVPLYLHKPIMYKYEFTPEATISKKIGTEHLPPVFVLAAGPFMTRFGPYMEPPDKEVTDSPIPVDAAFDREFTNDSAVLEVSATGDALIKTNITESVGLNASTIYRREGEFNEAISIEKLTLLDEYGWSEVKADAYATDSTNSEITAENVKGEDHARVYFIDPALESIGIKLEKDDSKLKVINTGNRTVDVTVIVRPAGACMFVWHGGNMSKNWIGSIGSGDHVDLDVSIEAGAKISAEVLIPEKVRDKLEESGVSLKLEDEI